MCMTAHYRKGLLNITIDGDLLFEKSIPDIMPAGEYKLISRYHTKSNETLMLINVNGVVSAVRGVHLLTMG